MEKLGKQLYFSPKNGSGMTVGDLIEILKMLPEEAFVVTRDESSSCWVSVEVSGFVQLLKKDYLGARLPEVEWRRSESGKFCVILGAAELE